MARLKKDETEIDLTPMIDVVFQLIIFFVVTIKMDKDLINEDIVLAMSPSGKKVEVKEPGTVIIEVDKKGRISIGQVPLTPRQLKAVMIRTRKTAGAGVPILVRGDQKAKHHYVRQVMDACTAAGFWKIKFAAIKETAESQRAKRM